MHHSGEELTVGSQTRNMDNWQHWTEESSHSSLAWYPWSHLSFEHIPFQQLLHGD